MMNCGCGCKLGCAALAVVASLILGIATALLRINGTLVVGTAFLWVALGVAVVYLAVLLVVSAFLQGAGPRGCCICSVLPVVLTGILGSALSATVLLAFSFAATSIIGAIITGALVFFLALTVTAIACLIKCIIGCIGE